MSFRRCILRSLERRGKVYRVSTVTGQIKRINKFMSRFPDVNITIVHSPGNPYNLLFRGVAWRAYGR